MMPSFLSEKEWDEAQSIARYKGPLSNVEFLHFKERHDRFAVAHFLDFVFEIERLQTIIEKMDLDNAR